MNYTTHASLAPIEIVFQKTDKMTIAAAGVGVFAGFPLFGALFAPMLALPVLPLVITAVLAKYFGWDTKVYEYFKDSNKSVTQQEKEKLLQEALKKQSVILKTLKVKEKLSSEKIQELLNIQKELLDVISKLESDLAATK